MASAANFSNHFPGFSVTQTRLVTSAFLFGACASWMFLSFVIVQAFTYFRHYNKDPKFLKSIVYFIILLQLIQTGTDSYTAYAIDSAGWGYPNVNSELGPIVTEDLQPIFESLTGFIVQSFFTWRLWMFSGTDFMRHSRIRILIKIVCAFIALISALSLGTGVTYGVSTIALDVFPEWLDAVLVVWFASSAAADITITISLMALLLHAKASSYFGETRDVLSRLIRIVLQTGLLTSVLALLVIPLFRRNLIGVYALPWFVLGKSYIISLLANLNARNRSDSPMVRGNGINQATPNTKLSTVVFSPANHRSDGDGGNDSMAASLPVHSTVQMNGLDGSIISADITEGSV